MEPKKQATREKKQETWLGKREEKAREKVEVKQDASALDKLREAQENLHAKAKAVKPKQQKVDQHLPEAGKQAQRDAQKGLI